MFGTSKLIQELDLKFIQESWSLVKKAGIGCNTGRAARELQRLPGWAKAKLATCGGLDDTLIMWYIRGDTRGGQKHG